MYSVVVKTLLHLRNSESNLEMEIIYIAKMEIPKFYWVNIAFALLFHVCQY